MGSEAKGLVRGRLQQCNSTMGNRKGGHGENRMKGRRDLCSHALACWRAPKEYSRIDGSAHAEARKPES